MFSATVMWLKSEYFWKTVLSGRLWAGSDVMSLPSKRILPASGCSKPAMQRKSVVLPQPDGPSKVTNSFCLMDRL